MSLPLHAQHADHAAVAASDSDSLRAFRLGAMATVVASAAGPLVLHRTLREGYLTQPVVAGAFRALGGHLRAYATLNAEGVTLDRGELTPGMYGEGYVDRRHPHTYVHEVMAGATGSLGSARASAFAGKGFVPFGSDDPMMRPFEKFPVNHHLAQVIERALVVGSIRTARLTIEAASFNGDEPQGPSDWPNESRLFDSWAARATLRPRAEVELSASLARVQSPEDAEGFGLDHRKSHAGARFARSAGIVRYALVEWARTAEYANTRRAYAFTSLLGESQAVWPRASLALRLEHTDRPEETRAESPYRSIRPLLDFSILGVTRWTIATAHVEARATRLGAIGAHPFVEGAWHHAKARLHPTAIDPAELYGTSRIWSLSMGIRFDVGSMRQRMGYYGMLP